MEVTGKLVQILPVQSGEGKNGVWQKQEIILELDGTPPKKLCIGLWGDKIIPNLIAGSALKVSFDIFSNEYSNDKWYTSLKGWKVEVLQLGKDTHGGGTEGGKNTPEVDDLPPEIDDLPF